MNDFERIATGGDYTDKDDDNIYLRKENISLRETLYLFQEEIKNLKLNKESLDVLKKSRDIQIADLKKELMEMTDKYYNITTKLPKAIGLENVLRHICNSLDDTRIVHERIANSLETKTYKVYKPKDDSPFSKPSDGVSISTMEYRGKNE